MPVNEARQRLAIYLNGVRDGGLDLNTKDFDIAYFMWKDVKVLMESFEKPVQGNDAAGDFARQNRWHRAACQLASALDRESLKLTSTYEYPLSIGCGDWLFAAVMDVMVANEYASMPHEDRWWRR